MKRWLRRRLAWFSRDYRLRVGWLCCILTGSMIADLALLHLSIHLLPVWLWSVLIGLAFGLPIGFADVAKRWMVDACLEAISSLSNKARVVTKATPAGMIFGPWFALSFGLVFMLCLIAYVDFWPISIPLTILWWQFRRRNSE
jgi:hypothetical protein